jgi:sugar phosphate isomerase/epimerase
MKLLTTPGNTYWGLALAWYGDYTKGRDENPWLAKMDFLAQYGMKAFIASTSEIDALQESEKDVLFSALADRDMHCILHSAIDHMSADRATQDKVIENELRMLEKYIPLCRSDIVTTCAGDSHRYDNQFPWEEKVERFSRIMSPVAKLCWDMGAPFAIENHADYYVSDLLEILRATPRLYMFLDTANALHIGEQPVKACLDAAPYVVGTHFKDHGMMQSRVGNLHYEITGAALGDGAANLEKQYEIILEKSPFRDKLVMLFELFAPADMTPIACFEKSVDFIRGLQDGGRK